MKTASNRRLAIALSASLLAAAACAAGHKTPLVPTSRTPAAKGTVETRRTVNKNTEVNLEVEHLAPPSNVEQNATVYVVWAQPLTPDASPKNLGSLVVGKDRSGSLKTKTPHERFELIVTPEPSSTVSEPSHEPVMKAKVDR
ncbi:MAG TPA: hypothetical protein VM925_20645 [Labilithrix sp.]|nr:hypothetical protein [Labilithrix sp.]